MKNKILNHCIDQDKFPQAKILSYRGSNFSSRFLTPSGSSNKNIRFFQAEKLFFMIYSISPDPKSFGPVRLTKSSQSFPTATRHQTKGNVKVSAHETPENISKK